jgi:hypothetical protein
VGEQHRDRHVGVAGQGLLGAHALLAEAGGGGEDRRVVGVEGVEGLTDRAGHVAQDGGVEVDPAQAVDALGVAQDLPADAGAAQDRGVEGAAAQVVDGQHGAGVDPLLGGVVDGGRLGLHHQRHVGQLGQPDGLVEEVLLELAPVGRMGHRHAQRQLTLVVGHLVDHPAQQLGHELLGRPRGAAQDQGDGVADAALELAGHPVGLDERAALGRLTGDDLAVLLQQHHRRDLRRVAAEPSDGGAPVAPACRRRVRGAQVDAEEVGHANR